jgi:exodeoxyribonuclease-3
MRLNIPGGVTGQGQGKKNIGWRIDYFLVSEKLLDGLENAEIHNDVFGSDHCPVSISF